MRSLLLLTGLCAVMLCSAQDRIDSVHVFKKLPEAQYTSANANALAWNLHKGHAPYRTIKGTELSAVTEAMKTYTPTRHTYGTITGLTNVAVAFSNGRVLAFGVADDMDRVINFTARTEYRISSLSDHIKVRAVLAKVLLTQ